jgi:hypothetical protein
MGALQIQPEDKTWATASSFAGISVIRMSSPMNLVPCIAYAKKKYPLRLM